MPKVCVLLPSAVGVVTIVRSKGSPIILLFILVVEPSEPITVLIMVIVKIYVFMFVQQMIEIYVSINLHVLVI